MPGPCWGRAIYNTAQVFILLILLPLSKSTFPVRVDAKPPKVKTSRDGQDGCFPVEKPIPSFLNRKNRRFREKRLSDRVS